MVPVNEDQGIALD